MLEDHSYVTEDDEGWRKNWALMERHNELVTLELPNLVGDGLHLEECITVMMDNERQKCHTDQASLHPLKNKLNQVIGSTTKIMTTSDPSLSMLRHCRAKFMEIEINAAADYKRLL